LQIGNRLEERLQASSALHTGVVAAGVRVDHARRATEAARDSAAARNLVAAGDAMATRKLATASAEGEDNSCHYETRSTHVSGSFFRLTSISKSAHRLAISAKKNRGLTLISQQGHMRHAPKSTEGEAAAAACSTPDRRGTPQADRAPRSSP